MNYAASLSWVIDATLSECRRVGDRLWVHACLSTLLLRIIFLLFASFCSLTYDAGCMGEESDMRMIPVTGQMI